MQITRTSVITGIRRTRDLPITERQFEDWHRGELITRAMPNLSPDDREFLMSGTTAEERDEKHLKGR